ncbi:MAG TPA: BON domain-containing protein [Candidatus Limnocylindrales bacterium]
MTNQRTPSSDTPPPRASGRDPGSPDTRQEVDPDVAELLGLRPADAGDLPDLREIDDSQQTTDTAIDEGELTSREPGSIQPDVAHFESLADDEARAGETDDPEEAAEEGLAWIPPTDPPVILGRDAAGAAAEVAAGFGTTAEDEPFDADHHGELLYASDERTARVEEALRADARTSAFADRIEVEADGDQVRLSGSVDDLDDEDDAIAVAEAVTGVVEVVSQLEVTVLESTPNES